MKTDHLALLRSGAPLSTRQQISLTLQLSWPAIMAQLATIIMQYIDAAMVGRLGASPVGRQWGWWPPPPGCSEGCPTRQLWASTC